MEKKIKVYSTPSCPYCVKVKDFLKSKNLKFQDINVAEDSEAAQEMVDKTGQYGVPVIEIEGKIVVGFDKEKIEELLKS